MLSYVDICLRAVNFVFLLIILGLSGSLADTRISNSHINFCVFEAVWGILTSTIYGGFAYVNAYMASPIFLATLDFLNMLFTFAGATALANLIGAHSCSNTKYLKNDDIAQGSKNRCGKAQATVAFMYFSFFIFLYSFVMQVINVVRNGLFNKSGSPNVEKAPEQPVAEV